MLRIKILEALYTNPMKMIDFNEYMHACEVTTETIQSYYLLKHSIGRWHFF